MAMMRPLRTKTPAPIMFPTANATAAERLNPFDRFAPPGIAVYVRRAVDKAAGRGFTPRLIERRRPRPLAGADCRTSNEVLRAVPGRRPPSASVPGRLDTARRSPGIPKGEQSKRTVSVR